MRLALLSLVALGSSGCGLIIGSTGPDMGPEQFDFVVELASGPGAEAERLAREQMIGDPEAQIVEGTAEYVATIASPGGTLDVLTFEVATPRGRMNCESFMGPMGGSMTCAEGADPLGAEPVEALTSDGTSGSTDWSEATIRTRSDVASISATANDGTVYELTPGAGFAYVMWPNGRGDLQLEAFDADGNPLGTLLVESVE